LIPVNEPLLDGNERRYLLECVDQQWISSGGPFVQRFERDFGGYLGLPPGVAVCNGTAAIETALFGLGLRPGDEVIMPSFTIISCALAALRLGATPVLVDIEPGTWCMDVDQLEAAASPSSRVVMPVHVYGHPADMDPVMEFAKASKLSVLEDAAEVHGAEYRSKASGGKWLHCGAIGHAASFSFYANKIVTTGEGGMVVSADPDVLARARSYQNLCFRPERRFYHTELGYNFRMTNLQAAIGVAQLERIDEFVALKRRFGAMYRERLAGIPGVRMQTEHPWGRTVYWMYAIELDPSLGIDAEELARRLKDSGVETRPFFMGLHAQPALQGKIRLLGAGYQRTEHAYRYGLYLPSGMTLTESLVDEVCDRLRAVLR
jgi:perosamine synthetase